MLKHPCPQHKTVDSLQILDPDFQTLLVKKIADPNSWVAAVAENLLHCKTHETCASFHPHLCCLRVCRGSFLCQRLAQHLSNSRKDEGGDAQLSHCPHDAWLPLIFTFPCWKVTTEKHSDSHSPLFCIFKNYNSGPFSFAHIWSGLHFMIQPRLEKHIYSENYLMCSCSFFFIIHLALTGISTS